MGLLVFFHAVDANCQRLGGLPRSSEEMGNQFVDAWFVLRRNMDSLANTGGHPALLDKWFAEMPEFPARDAAHIATVPAVILAAAKRLAKIGGSSNERILADLERKHVDTPLGERLRVIRVKFGNRNERKQLDAALDSPWPRERLRAAVILAEAGMERGKEHLKGIAQGGAGTLGFVRAVRTLGRVCKRNEDGFLKELQNRYPKDQAILAARGELAMRFAFPYHYQMLRIRNPAMIARSDESDIYDSWFIVIGSLTRDGVKTSTELLDHVEARMRALSPGDQSELRRRRLQTLVDFWRNVDGRLVLESTPNWPRDFGDAKSAIGWNGGGRASSDNPAPSFADKVSAAIAILTSLGRQIGHQRLASLSSKIEILTPGGSRAVDGNMATSWHGSRDDFIAFEQVGARPIRAIWLMSNCPGESRSGIEAVQVEDMGGGWSIRPRFDSKMRYFQKITLPATSPKRLRIRVLETVDDLPGCLSEIRSE